MRTIIYYISEYGFGHATRSIALIREILNTNSDIRIIICTNFSLEFIKSSLKEFGNRVVYRKKVTDVGFVLFKYSLQLDKDALNKACNDYLLMSGELANQEVDYLSSTNIECIVSDISPIAFEIGNRMNLPTVGISNFTWWTAYKGVIDSSINNEFKAMYKKMDHFIQLAGSMEPEFGRKSNIHCGFFCREVDDREVQRLRHQLNPSGNKQIVFIPIGMKIELNMADWPLWDNENCVFVVSSHMNIQHPNVVNIPAAYTEVQNYIAAADLVISKAGWGTVSEAVAYHKPLLIIDRKEMNEDRNTIQYLVEHRLCELVSWEQLLEIKISNVKYSPYKSGFMNNRVEITKKVLKIINEEVVTCSLSSK
ncbi:glycosyltransferase [Fictibacillus enclensis]|uniref:glycosyltransferase n=1 Tax=Fictibacillus enclensis TaxID=1017270 RepID=UPI0025A2A2B1|nr:glycosyltransferase [Fictibacillus enclensis]MDM5340533.1 glycosyltransferase [Fictibacillus enclensis]